MRPAAVPQTSAPGALGSPIDEPTPDPTGVLAGVVLPIRSFTNAKTRLAAALDAPTRIDLVRTMAQRVLDAAPPHPVVVVSNAPEVLTWAADRRLPAVADEHGSLDGAASAGRAFLAGQGHTRIVIAHADLPRALSLSPVVTGMGESVVAIVPCHRGDGTNVLSVPAAADFRFAYGPGSYERHVAEARRLSLEVRIVREPDLMFDIDEPGDLDLLDSLDLPRPTP